MEKIRVHHIPAVEDSNAGHDKIVTHQVRFGHPGRSLALVTRLSGNGWWEERVR
jgi:hypothetical protein